LAFAAGLSGCGMSGYESHATSATTTAQVMVVATGTSSGNVTTESLILAVNITQ